METETLTVHPWLAQFDHQAQPLITAWFAAAAGQGAQHPEAVLASVTRLLTAKLDWSTTTTTREACHRVLLALLHQRAGARAYAATFLAPGARRP